MLQIQSKRFYLDVKQNRRGRFIKVAEVSHSHSLFFFISLRHVKILPKVMWSKFWQVVFFSFRVQLFVYFYSFPVVLFRSEQMAGDRRFSWPFQLLPNLGITFRPLVTFIPHWVSQNQAKIFSTNKGIKFFTLWDKKINKRWLKCKHSLFVILLSMSHTNYFKLLIKFGYTIRWGKWFFYIIFISEIMFSEITLLLYNLFTKIWCLKR